MLNQITKILPRNEWQKIVINETNESIVKIHETSRLKLSLLSKQYKQFFCARKTVAEKLLKVSEILPRKVNLVLIEGYRTLKSQQELWDTEFQKFKEWNPKWTDKEIEKQVRLVIAKPSPLANHHCGGAVDVTLAYSDGKLLDMGSPYLSKSIDVKWHKKFQMLSEEITSKQIKNRKILRDAMETEDFVWYPNEWWHYCFGDRMWAVYSNNTKCFYGPMELNIDDLY